MFGKHYENRPTQIFVHTYSRVPNLDTQIFNIQVQGLKQSRRQRQRTSKVIQGLERAKQKSQKLTEGFKTSKKNLQQDDMKFISDLKQTQQNCLQKEKSSWQSFSDEKNQSRFNYIKDSKYLDDLLQTNATKAASRITSVRRWQ